MERLLIKIHSVVDVITNSSTTVYTMAGPSTIKTIKLMVDSILRIAGSDVKAEEMFDFELTAAGADDFRWEKWINEHPEAKDMVWADRAAAWKVYKAGLKEMPGWRKKIKVIYLIKFIKEWPT